jgi:hypothetical protein
MRDILVKKIKLMFDYSSSCLWDNSYREKYGTMIEAEDINLSSFIEKKIDVWCIKMDKLFFTEIFGKRLTRKIIIKSNKYKQYKKEQIFLSKLIHRDTGLKVSLVYE